MQIPADTLKAILKLRAENGLEASESAVFADLARAKAKWTTEETPRYRKAGRSPLYISGRYLTSAGICPATGEIDQQAANSTKREKPATPAPAASTAPAKSGSIDETIFYKVMHGKGFPVKISQNLLTGEVETQIPVSISKLNLEFSAIPSNASTVHVTQTSPQLQVSMPLDKFLELSGIKP